MGEFLFPISGIYSINYFKDSFLEITWSVVPIEEFLDKLCFFSSEFLKGVAGAMFEPDISGDLFDEFFLLNLAYWLVY